MGRQGFRSKLFQSPGKFNFIGFSGLGSFGSFFNHRSTDLILQCRQPHVIYIDFPCVILYIYIQQQKLKSQTVVLFRMSCGLLDLQNLYSFPVFGPFKFEGNL